METRKIDEPPKTMLAEQSSIVEKAYDPGWNDPPPMSYESASGPVKKGILNKPKRIAFPLDSSHSQSRLAHSPKKVSSVMPNFPLNSCNQSPVPPLSMPPLHVGLPPSATLENKAVNSTENNAAGITPSSDEVILIPNEKHSLESIQDVFNNILETINESKDVAEIKKRIGVMTEMWKSNKLDVKVQHQMFLFAEALKKGRPIDANEIQKSLAVNHTSQCSTWMAGVRKLVQYASPENATSVQKSSGFGHTQNIGSKEKAEDGYDVDILASKVQDL